MKNPASVLALFLLLHLCTQPGAFAQAPQYLKGVVVDAQNNVPVKGLTVYTEWTSCVTDDYGKYRLNLENCGNCRPGESVVINTYSETYGFSENYTVVPLSLVHKIKINRDPRTVRIQGNVRDAKTREFIPGVMVKIVLDREGITKAGITDKFGAFEFYFRKEEVGADKPPAYFTFLDEKYGHATLSALMNIRTIVEAYLEPAAPKPVSLKVSTQTTSRIKVSRGDKVTIKAHGNIIVGPWVGGSDPDGRSSGFAGASLAQYNLVPNFNHAALLYRISRESGWRLAGKSVEFEADQDGALEFQVNDNDQGNNSGSYDVDVTIVSER
jgi:hypothetical protein